MTMSCLETNYLIVGAGALGMSFLEELILNSDNKKAIIVDKRAGVGGHWRDSYDFVTLQCQTSPYGLNSSKLAPEGPCLPTKYQILEHYERGFERLEASGRVKFIGNVEYLGEVEDGTHQVKSLLIAGKEYKISVIDKLVDGTRTENHVPATRPPVYKVGDGAAVVPVNRLARPPPGPWSQFYVVGAGKTGIDAVLYLLDREVDPENIFLIVPNDFWFFNRCNPDKQVIIKKVFLNPNLEDTKSTLHALEEEGFILRLSSEIEPTKLRGFVSVEDLEKFRSVNIIRKGRVEEVADDTIYFQSGEQMTTNPDALFVDCSTPSTLAEEAKPIYEEKTINLQYLTLPPNPGLSSTTIAAIELKYPENTEKKNEILKPINIPQTFIGHLKAFYGNLHNEESIDKELGLFYQRSRRNFPLNHLTWDQVAARQRGEGKEINNQIKEKLVMLIQSEQSNDELAMEKTQT